MPSPFFFASAAVAMTSRTPGASTATGFSQKMCLPAATAFFKCCGAEAGRRGEDDDVDVRREHLVDRIEPDELVAFLDLHLVGLGFADVLEARVDALADDIAHRGQHHILVRGKRVAQRAGAAAAAADDAELERLVIVRADDGGEADDRRGGERGGGAGEESAAVEGCVGMCCSWWRSCQKRGWRWRTLAEHFGLSSAAFYGASELVRERGQFLAIALACAWLA